MVEPTSVEMLKCQVLASQDSFSAGVWHDVSSEEEIGQAAKSDFQRKQKQQFYWQYLVTHVGGAGVSHCDISCPGLVRSLEDILCCGVRRWPLNPVQSPKDSVIYTIFFC